MKKNSFHLVSLGCAKNLVDSNVMAQLLEAEGLTYTDSPAQAEYILVNTCGFIHDARQESQDSLWELAQTKKSRQKLIVTGCLAERWREKLLNQHPGVDGLIGTRRLADIIPLVRQLGVEGEVTRYQDYPVLQYEPDASYTAIQGGSSYLKIGDGCHRSCAFCAIPGIKGSLVSRPMIDIIRDAQFLQEVGVKEINLIAQDVTAYGADRGETNGLTKLLRKVLPEIPAVPWLRLLYTYPGMISDDLIDLMASSRQLLPYLDIPLQHTSPEVLKSMRRPSDIDWVRRTIKTMRERIPDLVVRTTFIVGFPTETEENFQELYSFVEEIGFDHMGVFTYSPEVGTFAESMGDPVSQDTKQARREALMELQSRSALEKKQDLVGKTFDILVEGVDQQQKVIIGRTYRDAPEIDGLVVATGLASIGEMIPVKIESAGPYDLFGLSVHPRK
ncbi:MAG: 30S ribosomal protein S12 methylthiotransferase RimO [Anaerolineaceae bacterium]|nr:30S ribosomal protein S12 methylthiotransferase RimO [Anaerolineaceae bacterium]